MTAGRLSIRKGYVEPKPGKQIHYRYVLPPDGIPHKITYVYLHKSASSSASWEKLMLHYASLGHPSFAPDMPGFGGSFDPSDDDIIEISAQNTMWYVELYMKVFELLGLYDATSSKQACFIGHHSGSCLSQQIASVYPDFIKNITLIGPTVLDAAQRAESKKIYYSPFNKPAEDGSHLTKTWNYLRDMGVTGGGSDLEVFQREAVDHIRAWRGRMLIYGAVWDQDHEEVFRKIKCPVLALCARDDVLWHHVQNVKKVRPDAKVAEIKGANFSLDWDVPGIIKEWDLFQKENP